MVKKTKEKEISKLTFQFIPYNDIKNLVSGERIKKLLNLVLDGKIILLQGRLDAGEEARLIEDTMIMIDHVRGFKGIELAVLSSKQDNAPFYNILKDRIAKFLIGERDAITIIGPASIVHEIKKDPTKIEMMLKKK